MTATPPEVKPKINPKPSPEIIELTGSTVLLTASESSIEANTDTGVVIMAIITPFFADSKIP